MTIIHTADDGEIIILFDSRRQFPELLGYKSEDPEYKFLRRLWEEAVKGTDVEESTANQEAEALLLPALASYLHMTRCTASQQSLANSMITHLLL